MQASKQSADIPRENTEPRWRRKRIGSNTYYVAVHFSQTNKETMGEKILRLVEREAERP